MYLYLYQTHKVVVVVFLLIYVVKTALLLFNKTELLEKVTKAIKVPEMIVSFLFLITGATMLALISEIRPLLLMKIGVVVVSIPVAIIGFKKSNKLLAALSLFLIFGAYGMAEVYKRQITKPVDLGSVVVDASDASYDVQLHGKALYESHCNACHGEAGDKGGSGAANLQVSQLSDTEVANIIKNGKNVMPAYKKFSEEQINALVKYTATLKK